MAHSSTLIEIAHDEGTGLRLLLERQDEDATDNHGHHRNFVEFNRQCNRLDANYLCQPVNEADYDSETQVCVDRMTGGPESYFAHYVPAPQRKRMANSGLEEPYSATAAAAAAAAAAGASSSSSSPHSHTISAPSSSVCSPSASTSVMDLLPVPVDVGLPTRHTGDGGHILLNPTVRRRATGVMPTSLVRLDPHTMSGGDE